MLANKEKYFSEKHAWKKMLRKIFVTMVYFWLFFSSKKDNLFWHIFVFRRGTSNAICDLVLYLKSDESLSISRMYPGNFLFQYFKTVFAIQCSIGSHFNFLNCDGSIDRDLRSKFRQKRMHLFLNTFFWSLIFKFFI